MNHCTPQTTIKIPNYQITETVYLGSRTIVFRAIRTNDQLPVVIKLLKNDYPTFSELVQFRNQYTIAKNLHSPLIIQTYSLEPYQNSYALVIEDFGGISLQEWGIKRENQPSLSEFLVLAITLCNALEVLYRERIIHKDIKPSNILINPETKEVKLIDFSIASLLPKETQTLINPNVLEGTLAYISPEQTGRMNRGIDYRTDFYSLGITFYELLIGKLPFESNDPMELVHCHLAKTVPLINEISSEIPSVLSKIVRKLMEKNAESRYQSVLGLKYDLENCLSQLQKTGQIKDFEIAQRDVSDRFLIPEKLYGRETEVQTLLQAFERVSEGATEMMLVAGFSGIGKTAVVNEVHKPIVRQRGYFIKGKFDQLNRNVPFSAFVQAFRDLVGQLLSESDGQLQTWKTQILDALGENAQVIIDLIPELEKIIGEQAAASELSGTAAQNRFNLLFQRFINVFTKAEHPLVMFVDDLQWADSASLNLIQVLMSESQTSHLLLLGAYRDNEVFAAHPLILTLNDLEKAGATIQTITLQPLSFSSLNQLVAETLHAPAKVVEPLTELVRQKTEGNPFFATQFLKVLHQDELITFDGEAGNWQCDIVQVRDAALTDDVVEFMALQLQKLPETTQTVLKFAACVGAEFDLETLAISSEQPETEVAASLWRALQEGLILPQSDMYKFYLGDAQTEEEQPNETPNYKFLHDRVQQAAYSLIPDEQKQATHLKMGQLLQRNASKQERDERLFEIVNHLNVGLTLITQREEQGDLAELNLAAGRKAKLSTAYETALSYLSTGIDLLPDNVWESHYPLALALHEEITEASYLNTDYEQMEQSADVVLQQATTLLDTIKVQQTLIMGAKAQGQLLDSINIGLKVLQELGIEFPEQPTQGDIGEAYEASRSLWIDKPPQSLIDLPTMSDPHLLAAMDMLTVLVPAAYMASPNLMLLLIFKQVQLSIQSGNTPVSIFAYGDYGLILSGIMGDILNGYEFGELALSLLEKFQAKSFKGRSWYVVHAYIKPWKNSLFDLLPRLQEAYRTSLETGDMEALGWNAFGYCGYAYHSGQNLTQIFQTMEDYRQIIVRYKLAFCLPFQEIYQQTALNFLGQAEFPDRLTGEIFNQEKSLPQLQSTNQRTALFFLFFNQSILYYIFGKNDEALQTSTETAKYLDGGTGMFMVPLYFWFDALIQLARCTKITQAEERESILLKVQQHQTQLHHWATLSPENHQHRWELVEAERCRLLGHKTDAIEAYERAIAGAKENKFIQDEALANELAAKFYLGWGKEKVAAGYMQEAYYCYSRWGAKAKTDDLAKHYPELLRPILQQVDTSVCLLNTMMTIAAPTMLGQSSSIQSSSTSSINQTLDFAAILKASQALSRVIQLDELLHQLTQLILQNSGGDRCALILPTETREWQVRAIATKDDTQLCTEPLANNPNLPAKLIQYVKNIQEIVIIDDLVSNLPVFDDYLTAQQPKSLLCLPLMNQGQLIGILSLENRLASGVFAGDRILIINFLCTQAAISLENASLYEKVQQTLTDLQQAQLQIVQSEKMSALGNLVAGVAHEMNNPLGFIAASLELTKPTITDIIEHLKLYQKSLPSPSEEILDHESEIDLEYSLGDLPKIIDSMAMACDRLKNISTSLRTFSRADQDYKVPFYLYEGIDSTVMILKHRLKANDLRPAIEVVTEYGDIPQIQCFPGQLNQVFMNILANAIDALDESNQGRNFEDIQAQPNCITITTSLENDGVKVVIADNGKGMSEEVRHNVFDYLFTTKEVGKGTGLGLAIARQIVEEKHGGHLSCNSELGQGTEFVIQIPLKTK